MRLTTSGDGCAPVVGCVVTPHQNVVGLSRKTEDAVTLLNLGLHVRHLCDNGPKRVETQIPNAYEPLHGAEKPFCFRLRGPSPSGLEIFELSSFLWPNWLLCRSA